MGNNLIDMGTLIRTHGQIKVDYQKNDPEPVKLVKKIYADQIDQIMDLEKKAYFNANQIAILLEMKTDAIDTITEACKKHLEIINFK